MHKDMIRERSQSRSVNEFDVQRCWGNLLDEWMNKKLASKPCRTSMERDISLSRAGEDAFYHDEGQVITGCPREDISLLS